MLNKRKTILHTLFVAEHNYHQSYGSIKTRINVELLMGSLSDNNGKVCLLHM